MTKKQKILIGLAVVGIVLIIVLFVFEKKPEEETKITPTPTGVATPTIVREQLTGGLVEQTPDEELMVKQVSELRLATPVDAGKFMIYTNWKNGKFNVKGKEGQSIKIEDVSKWLNDNGFVKIPIKEFVIE